MPMTNEELGQKAVRASELKGSISKQIAIIRSNAQKFEAFTDRMLSDGIYFFGSVELEPNVLAAIFNAFYTIEPLRREYDEIVEGLKAEGIMNLNYEIN